MGEPEEVRARWSPSPMDNLWGTMAGAFFAGDCAGSRDTIRRHPCGMGVFGLIQRMRRGVREHRTPRRLSSIAAISLGFCPSSFRSLFNTLFLISRFTLLPIFVFDRIPFGLHIFVHVG